MTLTKIADELWLKYIPRRCESKNLKAWNDHINLHYAWVRSLDVQQRPRDPELYAVILEPRQHPHLEFVIRNVLSFLGPDWGLQILHGTRNAQFVHNIVKGWKNVELTNLQADNLRPRAYNKMKASLWLWDQIKGRKVLWFEPDAMLLRPGIEEFLDYDYVGAPWATGKRALAGWVAHILRSSQAEKGYNEALKDASKFLKTVRSMPVYRGYAWDKNNAVGNGGLSLRDVEMMRMCCRRFENLFPEHDAWHEDLFFVKHLPEIGGKIAPYEEARRFCIEQNGTLNSHHLPMATHKPYQNLGSADFQKLLSSVDYSRP